MSQKLYFLAEDSHNPTSYDSLWVTDGTTTTEVGGLGNASVAGSGGQGLQPTYMTTYGDDVIFAGVDASGFDNTNVWISDGTIAGTTEVGGVTNGVTSPFPDGNPANLSPTNFVTFDYNGKALFFADTGAGQSSLWVTNGATNGTQEVGGFENGQVVNKAANWGPHNFAAFNATVLFDATDSSNNVGLWTTDGTLAGTQEIGGLDNVAVYDAPVSGLNASNFVQLGDLMLFTANDASGDANALWVTDGTASGTVEIGGAANIGVAGADKDAGLGGGLANAVTFGARVFFQGYDDSGAAGLWVTDGTASGTYEIGGAANSGVTGADADGLAPTDLTVNGQTVLFNGKDTSGDNTLWVTDGTASGTKELTGLTNEATNGLDPRAFVSLGNGKAVFIGNEFAGNNATGTAALWVTDGSFAGTQEVGGQAHNFGVFNVGPTGLNIQNNEIVGGDGPAYFLAEDYQSHFGLWETDGTGNGTTEITPVGAPATGLYPTEMALGAIPSSESTVSGGGKTVTLSSIPNEDVTLSATNGVADTVNGSNGAINMIVAQAAAYGGGLLISLLSCAVDLYNTNGNRDTVSFKGAGTSSVTLHGAQANVVGGGQTISFAPGTTGNYVYIKDTNGSPDTVNGSNGTIALDNAQANIVGGGDTVQFVAGGGDIANLSNTGASWDIVNGLNGTVGVVTLTNAIAQVAGGGWHVNFSGGAGDTVQLTTTGGGWDAVGAASGVSGTILLTSALTQVTGGAETVKFWGGSGDTVQFVNTSGWNAVSAASGSTGTVLLTSALAQVNGGGEIVSFWGGSGSTAQLLNTSGVWDLVNAASGSTGTVLLTSAWTQVYGGGDTINYWGGTDNRAQLVNTGGVWDTVNAASGSTGTTYLTNAWAQINGGGETAYFWGGSGNLLHLANTGTSWDIVNAASGSAGTVFLTNGWAQINGGGDNVQFLGGTSNTVHLANTGGVWDGVSAASGITGTVDLTSGQTQVSGGGDTVNFLGGSGNQVSLVNTGASADNVNNIGAVTGTVYLTNAHATIQGSGDTVNFYAGTNNAATVTGSNEAFVINQAAFGLDSIGGFTASDTLSFNVANQGHLNVSQSGGSTLVTLDGSDVVTLSGYTGAINLSYHG